MFRTITFGGAIALLALTTAGAHTGNRTDATAARSGERSGRVGGAGPNAGTDPSRPQRRDRPAGHRPPNADSTASGGQST